MAVDIERVIQWLPNSAQYNQAINSVDTMLLETCLRVVVAHVSSQCEWLGEQLYVGDEPVYIDESTQTVLQPDTDEWPEQVQQATVMLICDLYNERNRPGVLDVGTYMPRNHAAEKLLAPFLTFGFA